MHSSPKRVRACECCPYQLHPRRAALRSVHRLQCRQGRRPAHGTAANELAAQRITVNAIAPGWIDTPGERDFATETELTAAGRRLPWGRLGRPEEIGAIAAFLASDQAEFISGALIRADGAQMVALGS